MKIDSISRRSAAILPILEKICRSGREDGAIPMCFALPGIAQELSGIWEKPVRTENFAEVISRIQKIKMQTQELFEFMAVSADTAGASSFPDPMARAGISSGMAMALYGVLNADVYSKATKPKRGRPSNGAATHLAIAFARHFPMVAGIPASASKGGRFVWALGEIYTALGFAAKPEPYARKAVAALKAAGVK